MKAWPAAIIDAMTTASPALDAHRRSLETVDPQIAGLIKMEEERQETNLELIASENIASLAVRQAMMSVLTDKYAEGYPGKRYYGGCEVVDEVEALAIERVKELYGAEHANVQPHSGAQANMAAYLACHQARRHDHGHEPRSRRPPDPWIARQLQRPALQRRALRRDARTPR